MSFLDWKYILYVLETVKELKTNLFLELKWLILKLKR